MKGINAEALSSTEFQNGIAGKYGGVRNSKASEMT
jgi:hypothetical protein